MEKLFCQSCAMPMNDESIMGRNSDGTANKDYCVYCFKDGEFTAPNITMNEMIEVCVPFMKEDGINEEVARNQLKNIFPNLKRWQNIKEAK